VANKPQPVSSINQGTERKKERKELKENSAAVKKATVFNCYKRSRIAKGGSKEKHGGQKSGGGTTRRAGSAAREKRTLVDGSCRVRSDEIEESL